MTTLQNDPLDLFIPNGYMLANSNPDTLRRFVDDLVFECNNLNDQIIYEEICKVLADLKKLISYVEREYDRGELTIYEHLKSRIITNSMRGLSLDLTIGQVYSNRYLVHLIAPSNHVNPAYLRMLKNKFPLYLEDYKYAADTSAFCEKCAEPRTKCVDPMHNPEVQMRRGKLWEQVFDENANHSLEWTYSKPNTRTIINDPGFINRQVDQNFNYSEFLINKFIDEIAQINTQFWANLSRRQIVVDYLMQLGPDIYEQLIDDVKLPTLDTKLKDIQPYKPIPYVHIEGVIQLMNTPK